MMTREWDEENTVLRVTVDEVPLWDGEVLCRVEADVTMVSGHIYEAHVLRVWPDAVGTELMRPAPGERPAVTVEPADFWELSDADVLEWLDGLVDVDEWLYGLAAHSNGS